MTTANDGKRSLVESILPNDVLAAMEDWTKAVRTDAVLVGGLARSFYVKPFYTDDIDFLFGSAADVPTDVRGFERLSTSSPRTRPYQGGECLFRHRTSGIQVDALEPEDLDVPVAVLATVFETAILDNGVRIASASGLVAMKLFGRLRLQDQADIVDLIKTGRIDLTEFSLDSATLKAFDELKEISDRERLAYG